MAGGMPSLLPIAVATSASAVAAIAGASVKRRGLSLLVSAALALAGALWHVRAQEVGLWFSKEQHFLAVLVAAAVPPLIVGLLVFLPSSLGMRFRSLLTALAAVILVAGWLAILQAVEAAL